MSVKNKCTKCKKIVDTDELYPCVLCNKLYCIRRCDKCDIGSCSDAHENECISARMKTIRNDILKSFSNFPHNGDLRGREQILLLEGILRILKC